MSSMPGAPTPDPDEEVTHTVTTKTASGTEVKINVRVDKHGEASATADSDVAEGDDVTLSKEGLEALANLVLGERKQERVPLGTIRRQLESLNRISHSLPLTESVNFRAAYSILVKNVGDKLDSKMKSGEINQSELMQEATNIMGKMKDMPGMDNIQEMLSKMGGLGGLSGMMGGLGKNMKVDVNAMQAQMDRTQKMNSMKDRMKKNLVQKQMAAAMAAAAAAANVSTSSATPQMSEEELISFLSEKPTGVSKEGAKKEGQKKEAKKKKNKNKK
jgi:hypothetical protein